MFEKALIFLKNQINTYLTLKTGEDNKISLSPLTDGESKTVLKDLGITLVNLEEDRTFRNQNPYKLNDDGNYAKVNPEIHLNLFILIAANFGDKETDYRESLKFLSHVATFFQGRNVFTNKTYPDLDQNIDKLVIEMVNLPFESQNNLWASLGAKYMPSLLYKVRMITLKEEETQMEAPPVMEANLTD